MVTIQDHADQLLKAGKADLRGKETAGQKKTLHSE
jgi:hypothetical protein